MPNIKEQHIACPYCDALHQREKLSKHEVLVCDYCHSIIDDGVPDFRYALIYALSALIFFIIANTFPFITLDLMGEQHSISIYSSISVLFKNKMWLLGCMVSFFIIIVPAWYLIGIVFAVTSFRFQILHEWVRGFLHWMHHLHSWNMIDVYLLGVLVTLVKIMQMADVTFETSFWSFLALILCATLAHTHFDLKDIIFSTHQHEPKRS